MADEHMVGGEEDDVQFMRTEDRLCLSCVPVSAIKRMALSGEVFGNRMCYLEDISNEVCCPDLASCIFVLEQAVSVRALQEMVSTTSTEQTSASQGGQTTFRTLLYGHAVLLRHYHSQMYLSCLSTSTSNDKLAFDVGLKEDAQGESCWWTIHPASKQRSEGEKVRFNDDVILVSVFSERYLHAYMSTSERGRVNASFRQQVWSLVPISSGVARVKNPGFVLGGDVIRIMHGNMDHCITTPPPDSQVIDDSGSLFIKSGASCQQARSLWRIECFKIKWYSGFVGWSSLVRLRHVTSGLYLAVIGDENGPKVTCISKKNASAIAVTFEMKMSKEKQAEEISEQENLGVPTIKYGDTIVFIRHVDSDLWISYETLELTIKGIGKVEEKRIIPAVEGHMDDCFRLVRAQEQEQKTALVIRICNAILGRFNRTDPMSIDAETANHLLSKSDVVQALLKDLIGFFSQPSPTLDHEERQLRLKVLKNRQDLFQEEGMIRILIAAINFFSERRDKSLLLEGVEEKIENITNKLYVVLAALIKGNRTNCSNFAQTARLNWLVNRLQSQQASGGVLEVLHSVLVDSPEVLNMITESHILAIIALLDRNGRDPKVLDVLCSLCVNNGVAVRANQNLICENILQRRDLLLQTALVDHVACMRPNILVGVEDGDSMYKKWYFEVVIDHIEQVTHVQPHIRIGWATTDFQPSPGHGDGFSSNGIGDNTYSYGFDGRNVWFAGRAYDVSNRVVLPTDNMQHIGFKKNDVIGCLLDLNIPEMWFSLNGLPVKGLFREFNLTGMFYPAISLSSRVSCRFIFGAEHGRFVHRPPEGAAPLYEAMLTKQKVSIEPCFSFGNIERNRLDGPTQFQHHIAFTPQPVRTTHIVLPVHLENVRDRLAENIHEMWSMNKISSGWRFGEFRDDSQKMHPCLTTFDRLPLAEKQYHTTTAMENLKSLLALGYHIGVEIKTDDRRLKYVKLPNTYVQANGYKPQPLDLSNIVLSTKMEELIETLAENTHNVWAAGRIKDGFTYGVADNPRQKRSPHLIPYAIVDDSIKKINRDTASETVKTLLAYGYTIESPTGDAEDLNRHNKEAANSARCEHISNYRTYRAEQTFAVSRGKWYYEVELLTPGRMLIGWAQVSKLDAAYPLGTDSHGYGYAFDGLNARRYHHNLFEGFGKQWSKNDVVGCMIDLHDKTISFSLNGELMLDNFGNETAFDGLEVDGLGYVPALTSFSGQKARLNFGQDVNTLKYFTSCGLQEGYEPFCVNMTRSLTFWYSNFIPRFETLKSDSSSFEVTRIGASRDNPPLIKLQSRLLGTLDKVEFEFLRLSLPLCCHDKFTPKQVTLERRQLALQEYIDSQEEKRAFAFPPTSGSASRTKSFSHGTSDTIDSHLTNQTDTNPNFLSPDSITNKSGRNPTNLLVKFRDSNTSKKGPSPSPSMANGTGQGGLMNGSSTNESIDRLSKTNPKGSTSKINNFFQRFSKEPQGPNEQQPKVSKRTVKVSGTSSTSGSAQNQPQSVLKVPTINSSSTSGGIPTKQLNNINTRRSFTENEAELNDQANDFEHDEIRAINEHVYEFYYAVRILPGQNPRSVFIGWVTSRFKPILLKESLPDDTSTTSASKLSKLIRRCTITQTGEDGSILESASRQDAYMFCASDLLDNMPDQEAVARRVVNGLLIGCLCDVSTGQLTFYVNGKESAQKLEVEPSTKLYPAVFVEPTVKEVLQFELGRIKNCLPLTAALFPSLNREERFLPQLPSRLNLQSLIRCHWSRVPNTNLRCQQLKLSDVRGWSVFVEDPVQMEAVYIPEDDRCTDILNLVEDEDNLNFCSNTLTLYNAICAQGNNRVSHEICKLVDEKQLMYCVKNPYLCGPIRIGIHNLLIALHFETHVKARSLTSHEFIIPLSSLLRKNTVLHSQNSAEQQHMYATTTYIPAMENFLSVRPKLIKEEDFKIERERKLLVPPLFNVLSLKEYIMNSLTDAIGKNSSHLRDPVGGTYSNWLVPLLQLVDSLLVMGLLEVNDIQQLLHLIDPASFGLDSDKHLDEGLLQMKLDEPVKLQLCFVLQHLCNYQLQYRIEACVAFSEEFVGRLQADQKRRYNVLKESSLPPALMAKKTREFRCPPKDQMQALMDFKRESEEEAVGNEDIQEEIKDMLKTFHSNLLILQQVVEANDDFSNATKLSKTNEMDHAEQISLFSRLLEILIRHALKKNDNKSMNNFNNQLMWKPGKTLCEVIKSTVIKWGRGTHIADPNLIREMFKLIYNQYDGIGEVSRCIERAYIINEKSVPDIKLLLRKLSIVRALLTVQMDSDEEEMMIACLNDIMDNRVFYQHPDLMRALCVHEAVMAIMVNRLNKSKQEQTSMSAMNDMDGLTQTNEAGENQEIHPVKEDKVELVTTCCKFLSYFCRTSRHNQRAMFEHLSYLLENSSMLLSRPSLRGSAPLDVASASVMDNNELALALRESHLEKIASYLSRCGTTRNEELFLQGYHDIGWDPVDGERFLDFLKFCVWVNGDTVEENADLVVRLLIRRPDCLGPALRGEGGGLLKAIREGIAQSLYIARRQNSDDPVIQAAYQEIIDDESMHNLNEEYDRLQVRLPYEDDEEYIDLGAAELSFYAILVELLGRCAPSEETIKMGKPNAVRAKSILKSLVSMHDLEGVLGLKFLLPNDNSMPPGLQPAHKMSIILFLERVYGIPDQETFFRLVEDAFLPDIRAATILDMAAIAESDMALALNRYLCNSVIPLMTSHSQYFDDCEHRSSLLESTLHTIYRLSKCRSLTKNQLDVICDFLLAFASQLKPSMMTPLLIKLVHDVPELTDQTIVPLRMLTQWYERCSRYYSVAATEEEKRLTMLLFQKIFDALASRAYDPELFGKALPCLTAIGSALSPDYSYALSQQDYLDQEQEKIEMSRMYEPNPADTSNVVLTPELEEFVKAYGESVHDQWSYAKMEQGWTCGEQINDKYRQHPNLKPYKQLDRKDTAKLEDPIREALKSIEKLQFHLEKTDTGVTRIATKPLQRKKQKDKTAPDYIPKSMDFASVTINREMQQLSEALAKNAHEIWARQLKNRLAAIGGGLHSRLVPYDLLTDKEKQKDLKFYQDLVKYLNIFGYRVVKKTSEDDTANNAVAALVSSTSSLTAVTTSQMSEKRFAYSLLEKLLEYVERASSTMQNYKESSKFSLHESYRLSTKDVKFFGKVVLPLVEKYFQAHRDYFITPSSLKTGSGYATVKEKEMSCSLFCKLAFLLRQKFSAFGNEVNISVRCLKVLVRAIDVSSVMKNSQEMVRASLLPLFNNIAEDLNQTVQNLEQKRFSHIKGTLQRGTTSLAYVHMVLLPVLASMLDHLGKNNYGIDVFENEIQLAGYKILNALWIIGTQGTRFVDREWIIEELNRHRPLLGDCLSSFASCFPIAFFEPEFNGNNKHASNISQLSPEANDVMTNITRTIPHLTKVIADIEEHSESRIKYEDAPHAIEVILPCVCSYLPYWWSVGPQKAKQSNEPKVTNVTVEHMNSVLGSVLKLVNNNIDAPEAPWMKRIAGYTQGIILNSSTSLLEPYFLPVSQRLKAKCEDLFAQEQSLKHATRLESSEREDLEANLMKNYEILVRDLYAFGPLLIKYVDIHRSYWLKNGDICADQLFNNMAEVFSTWCKSKYFKREELNFVSQHEIDNTSMLMPSSTNQSSAGSTNPSDGSAMKSSGDMSNGGASGGKQKRKKRRLDKEKFTSLSVACIKRLLPVGMNTFGGREQELVQLAKHKMIETKIAHDEKIENPTEEQMILDLTTDQEESIEEFLRDIFFAQEQGEVVNRNNWQSALYRKIGSKSHQTGIIHSQATSIKNMLKMAKVLFGLNLVDHPPTHRRGTWRKLVSSQRKKAIMACFRMAPLHSVPRHRAMNMFLRAYRELWLEAEEDTRARLIEQLCEEYLEINDQEVTTIKEENETETEVLTLTMTMKPDPLRQLLQCLNRAATTAQLFSITEDIVYLSYSTIMSKSCVIEEDDDDGGAEEVKSFQEQEMEKQKLLYEQNRLANRGAAETVLLYISASKGENNEMLQRTLQLGISLLHGGNREVQKRMLDYLKETKDVGCFTSLATLMANCSVLDLDTFERCIKAEVLGVGADGMAGEKNLHDADFTISLFRFCQLLCEGHNLEFQNYLRSQPGSNTNVNIIICTVDYLLSLQESLMDFYWHYSGKETVDAHGKENFCRAINVAKQVFNTLTEYIQGPCPQNQLALANSRLWDAIAGFLYIFAHMQRKLSQDPMQIELLRELMKLQKDMIIMLLSMLEGNVLNGPIGKQMVDTLIESQSNVELLLQFFDIFLKMKGLTTSEAFQEFDTNKDGFISPKEFRRAMEAQKMYTTQDIDYILMCVDTNQDGKIDFMEFTERFHNPAKDIGFNMAVLLTNLSEHMPHDIRLQRLMDKAKSFLSYFQEYLGRIEIKGGAGYIERVYFEITESNIEQWNKPHIKESKKAFLHLVVNETDDKEKLEQFINFCEDTIFEMQHAVALSGEEDDQVTPTTTFSDEELGNGHPTTKEPVKLALSYTWSGIKGLFHLLRPSTIRNGYQQFRQMTLKDMIKSLFALFVKFLHLLLIIIIYAFRTLTYCIWNLMVGEDQQEIKVERVALPPPTKRRDHHLPSVNISQVGFSTGEESSPMNAFGVGLSSDPSSKHKISLNEESINTLNFDSVQTFDSDQKSLYVNNIDSINGHAIPASVSTTAHIIPSTQHTQHQHSITASVPHQPQLTTTIHMSPNMIEKSKQSLEVNIQAEYQQKIPTINANGTIVEDDDFIPADPPARTDYGKKILALVARNYHQLKFMALCLAFVINFLMLFYKALPLAAAASEPVASDAIERIDEDDDEVIMMDPKNFYMVYLLRISAFLHSFIAFLMMISYYKLKVPLVIFKREKEIARKLEFEGAWLLDQPSENNSWILSYLSREWHKLVISSKSFPDSYWDKFVKKKVRNKYSDQFDYDELSRFLGMEKNDTPGKFEIVKPVETGLWGKIQSIDIRYQVWKWGVIFTDNSFLYVFFYFLFSVIGNFSFFVFAIHLLDVAISVKALSTILKSITHNGRQLLLTIMLMAVLVYLYTVIAFNFFRKFYTKEEDEEKEENCKDMFTCFKFHLYSGIRAGGGIGDELESPNGDPLELYRIIFDITFFFFIIVILLAIIQGLIIDAFGDLREQLDSVKETLESKCFICGIGQDYFDKEPHGFETHTTAEHNFANYMFFLTHLLNKPDTEHTGQESYVWEMYQSRKWDFFPVGDCFRRQYEPGGGGAASTES